jgi:drug/metabolite transporter (DMT)-like permease
MERIMPANILLFLSTLLWGVWGLANKMAVAKAHPFNVQWMYSIPLVLFLPVWFWLANRSEMGIVFDRKAIIWSILAAVSMLGATLFLLFGMQKVSASTAVAFTAAYPVFTLLLAVLLGLETFSLKQLAGIGLIIAGVILIQ